MTNKPNVIMAEASFDAASFKLMIEAYTKTVTETAEMEKVTHL